MEILRDEALLRRYLASFDGEYPWLSRYSWQLLRYQKGEYLCRYREPVPQLLFLLEGRVTVSLTPVSYTHLDVYKRQPSHPSFLRVETLSWVTISRFPRPSS